MCIVFWHEDDRAIWTWSLPSQCQDFPESCNIDMVAAVPVPRLSWISRVVTCGSDLIKFSSASMFATVTTVAGVPHQCSSSKLCLPRLNSSNKKKVWVLNGAFLLKKLFFWSCFRFSRNFSWCKPFMLSQNITTLKTRLEISIFLGRVVVVFESCLLQNKL